MNRRGSFLRYRIVLGIIVALPAPYGPIATWHEDETQEEPRSHPREQVVFIRSDQTPSVTQPGRAGILLDPTLAQNLRSRFIELIDRDGSSLMDLKLMGTDPSFSPDGKEIVFSTSQNSPAFQIAMMTLSDHKVQELTHLREGGAFGPTWSPEGKRIAFYAFRYLGPPREPSLYVMDADGGNMKKIADHASEPSWSPDGMRIVFTSTVAEKFEIGVIRADGTERKQITQDRAENSAPAWSPDGATIAFASDRHGQNSIYLMNADGKDQQRFLFSKNQELCFPAWSRAGDVLAFTSFAPNQAQYKAVGDERPKCEKWVGHYQIFLVGPDGRNPRLLTPKSGGLRANFGPAE